MKILVTEPISEEGLDILKSYAQVDLKPQLKPEEIVAIIGDYEALIVRSQTRVSAKLIEAAKKLQVIGRAGVGVDNVNVEEATRHGIVVVNAPTGNTISAAEHTIALMLSLARHIPQANAVLKSGHWKRSHFMGNEVRNKTLGIVGLGSVGSEVARRARGLEMKLVAHDPFVSTEHALNLEAELVPLKQLLKIADFITLHLPLTPATEGLIGAKELALVKPNVRIINSARGGLVDEEALVKAIQENKVAGAAFDVFTKEPITKSILFDNDNIIVTPHLGASTSEAQATVARDVATQVVDVLKGHPAKYSINAPFISPETLTILAPFIKAAATLGKLLRQLAEGQTNTIQIKYEGEISEYDTKILKASVLGGILEGTSEERINLVNASLIAAQRGLAVSERKEGSCENYASLITVKAATSTGTTTVAGTVLHGQTHIVRIDKYWLDIVPTGGYFLFTDHLDRPGVISTVSKITSDADVNISAMHVGRLKLRGHAIMVVDLDEALDDEQLKQIRSIPDIYQAKLVRL